MRYSGIGGQAVIEGVMMKGGGKYAVSVRKPDGGIEVKVESYKSFKERYPRVNIPIIRGVVAFVESLYLGMSTLNYSASLWEDEGEAKKEEKETEKKNDLVMGLVVMFAVLLAVGLFVLLPFFISELLSGVISSVQIRGLIEGVIRVALFVGYVKAISFMEDIHRVFMYHGAEHKCINCVENGCDLTVENAKRQTTVHKRCGTSFMLVVMFISILFFMFISVPNMWLRMVLRILLIPVIAGISYEFIIFAGKSDSRVVEILSKPGLWLQSLTTAEPENEMLEVAIASVEAVFDWRKFVQEAGTGQESDRSEQPKETALPKEDIRERSGVEEVAATREMSQAGFEVVDLDDDDEDDEILQALDRYFDASAGSEDSDQKDQGASAGE